MSARTFFVTVLLLVVALIVLDLGFAGFLGAVGALLLGGAFAYRRVRQLAINEIARHTFTGA